MSSRRTIVLIGDLAEYHDERRAASGTAIKPGMIVETTAIDEVKEHATAGSFAEILVAKEDDFQGRTVDTVYSVGDPVMLHRAQKGDLLQLILNAGENADPSKFGTSNGDGTIKVATSTDQRVFKFAEILDLTGGGAVDTRVKVYVV